MKRFRTTRITLAALLLLLVSLLAWHRFWPGPRRVESGLFELRTVLSSQAGFLWSVRFHPAGDRIVSASTDGTARVWTTDGAVVRDFVHPAGLTAADFSPDGASVATASYDGTLRIWNLADGSLTRTIAASSETLWCLAFSRDGRTIASAGEDRLVRLWNVADGSLLRTLAGHRGNVWSVAFAPDGRSLVSGSFDRDAILWNAANGEPLHVLRGHEFGIVTVAFRADGAVIVSGSDDGTARLWKSADGSAIATIPGGPFHVYAAEFDPSGRWLLLAGKDRPLVGEALQQLFGDSTANRWVTAQLLDSASGELLQTFSRHANDVNDACWSPDGNWIATVSEDGTIELWRRSPSLR